MVGVPYVGSGPLAHSLALDKVVAKMIFKQQGIPTPVFGVMDSPQSSLPDVPFPAIVKPKNESVSFGIRIVNNEKELYEGARAIFEQFKQPILVEHYIDGREINIGLLGNNPPITLPPVELKLGKAGPAIYTYEDKTRQSAREISWDCPAQLDSLKTEEAAQIAKSAFDALGCHDCARVDMRMDANGDLHVLEVNSLPSLGEHGSYIIAAEQAGLDFDKLVCRLVEVASARYFGTPSPPDVTKQKKTVGERIFSYLIERRDMLESDIEKWCHLSSRTSDPVGMRESSKVMDTFARDMGLTVAEDLTDERFVRTWQTKAGIDKGVLAILHLDVPMDINAPSTAFRRDPEWLYGEGIGTSRAPVVCLQYALRALKRTRRLGHIPFGLLVYTDEGRECRYSTKLVHAATAKASEVLVLRPGNLENSVITQRRGWRKYRFTVTGEARRVGKIYKKRGILRWTSDCLDGFAQLTSKERRVAVAISELRTEAYPQMLPHRAISNVYVSYLNAKDADTIDKSMREVINSREFRNTLELVSDRPPLRRSKRGDTLFRKLKEVADQWEIPLDKEFSLSPSIGGLAPTKVPTICGVAPIARDVDTPQEAVLRISVMQRTLLLAQYLASKEVNNGSSRVTNAKRVKQDESVVL
jgi:D-alanine-D-alanine ligase